MEVQKIGEEMERQKAEMERQKAEMERQKAEMERQLQKWVQEKQKLLSKVKSSAESEKPNVNQPTFLMFVFQKLFTSFLKQITFSQKQIFFSLVKKTAPIF